MVGLTFSFLSCYFPTSWDDDASIEGMYELLDSVLQGLGRTPGRVIIGGDFNACIGGIQPGDDLHSLGWWGVGRRNDRGVHLANWVVQNGFHILSRQTSAHDINESWTCQRYFDETRVQLDFILGDPQASVGQVWLDDILPIGLDHRCVHCIVTWTAQRRAKKVLAKGFTNWKPYLDENGEATSYQSKLLHIEASNSGNVNEQLSKLEENILMAGREGGECKRIQSRFLPSDDLKQLRLQRRMAQDRGIKKELSFEIVKLQRRELRKWKSSNLQMHLSQPNQWKILQRLQHGIGRQIADQPPPDDFADMLENIFSGHPSNPSPPPQLTEADWNLQELQIAIKRMKANKASDECGLVAELLHFAPRNVLCTILNIMNTILRDGEIPCAWRKTLFQMLPKTKQSKVTTDFRPIANIRLMYKIFAYLILGRIEAPLEQWQPEEQHGFRRNRRIEEHLLTANMVIDKTLLANTPLWIVSLDLSKAFDRVDWKSLWEALRLHGVSPHLIWLLQMTYANQKGQVVSNNDKSHEFDICAGVRQGCVLSPRLFCSVLQLAMGRWRSRVEHLGLNLGDGMSHLLDLRFADDILLFGESAQVVGSMLDALVTCLGQVGLKLNTSKTKVLTTQAQPPSTLTTPAGLELEVLEQTKTHKWLGCLLSTLNMGNRQQDVNYRLQNASRAFQANKWILCDKNVSIALRLKFFNAMVTSVVCFAAGHRKVYVGELRKLDAHCRKLLRRMVGPPPGINWNGPWHDILHEWHVRIEQQLECNGFKMWSHRYLTEYWKFANYVALLPEDRWVRRVLAWHPQQRRIGRTFMTWDSPLQHFGRWQHLEDWLVTAQATDLWQHYLNDFRTFILR